MTRFERRGPDRACRACGQRHAPPAVVGPVSLTHSAPLDRESYQLLHCALCDVVYLDPLPTPADLHRLYQQTEQFADATYTDPARVESMLAYYGTCIDHHKLLPAPGEASLEVGAGYAWVSRACKLRSTEVATIAQDVTSECAARCPWVDHYVVGEIEQVPRNRQFRLISLTHVIEHLVDPVGVLAALARRLLPHGRLLVTAPYRPTAWTPGAGVEPWTRYSYLHVPAHISYLSRSWFVEIGARCGLDLVHWDASHEEGQAFEAVLERLSLPERVRRRLRRVASRMSAFAERVKASLLRVLRRS